MPIARLLAMAFRSLIDALHERLAKRGIGDVRPAYGFVLLAARQAPIGVGDIGDLLGTTKQAASKLVDSLEGDGYVRRATDAGDGRARRIELTRRGHLVLEAVEEIYAELESEWGAIVGRREVERIRAILTEILRAQNGGSLPPVRPTW
jgi:DNA-binding MarR family transcriptional regulator